MVLLGNVSQVEACFGPFGDSVNLGATKVHVRAECTMGMEIIFGTADGTPRYRESCGSLFQSIWM